MSEKISLDSSVFNLLFVFRKLHTKVTNYYEYGVGRLHLVARILCVCWSRLFVLSSRS